MPSEQGVLTLIECIEQLLTDPSHTLGAEWARTAYDLHHNPVLMRWARYA